MGTFANTVCWHVQLLCVIENLQPQFNFACAGGVKYQRCKNLRPSSDSPAGWASEPKWCACEGESDEYQQQ